MGLLPKDDKFWHFFTSQTAYLSEAADLLAQATQKGNSQLASAAIRIKSLERRSSELLREVQNRLQKTFVTPIDPEDISLLSEHLDHLIDEIEAISYRLSAYHLEPIPPLMIEMSQRMHKCAELVEKAFGLLSLGESADQPCNEILGMEEEADQLIREGVTTLFNEETDLIKLMKHKEVYHIFRTLKRFVAGSRKHHAERVREEFIAGMDSTLLLVIVICFFAFCFDFLNGFMTPQTRWQRWFPLAF